MNDKCPYCGAPYKDTIGNSKRYACSTFLRDSPGGNHQGYECLLTQLQTCQKRLAVAEEILKEWRHVTYKGFISLQDKTDVFLSSQPNPYVAVLREELEVVTVLHSLI